MTARSTSNLTSEEREILNGATSKNNQRRSTSTRSTQHTDRTAARGTAANSIAQVSNQASDRLQNVERKIEQLTEQRQAQLEAYANAIAYLTDGDAFLAELAVLVEQKLHGGNACQDAQTTGEAAAITLDALDPYAQCSFAFNGKFFSVSTISLLGGN